MTILGNGGDAFVSDPDLGYAIANEHANRNFVIARAVFLSKTTGTPPGSPAAYDAFILPASPTDDWLGHGHEAVFYDGAGWLFWPVAVGYVFTVLDVGTNGKRFVKATATPSYVELHTF